MFFGRQWSEWIAQYETSHRNRVNRLCHMFGIPMIAMSIALAIIALIAPAIWPLAMGAMTEWWRNSSRAWMLDMCTSMMGHLRMASASRIP